MVTPSSTRESLPRCLGVCFVACVFATFTSNCDRVASNDVVTIRFWNGFTGPDGRTMLALIKRFNRENPDVNVVMQRMEWATYYNKLFVAGLGGRAPEVFASHRSALQRFIAGGFVRPADDLLGKGANQIDPDDIDANVLAALEQGGHHWAIPLDVHPEGMFYNRAMFRAAGIVDEKGEARPPTNRAEFLDAVRRLKHDRTATSPQTWGYVFTWERNEVYSVMRQLGGQLFDSSLTRATFADPRNVAGLELLASLVRDGLTTQPQGPQGWVGFRQGRVGMVFQGIFMMPDLRRDTDLDWAAAPLPVLGDHAAAWADSHSLCIRKDLTGKQLDAAERLIKFLSDNSLDWAEGGQVPVRKHLRDSDRFRAMKAQYEFSKQIPYIAYCPPTQFVFEYLTEFDAAIELALRGTQTPQQALAGADVKVQQVIARYQNDSSSQQHAEAR